MAKKLFIDFVTFLQIVVYWPLVLLVMLPCKYIDKILGTHLLRALVRLTKAIANAEAASPGNNDKAA